MGIDRNGIPLADYDNYEETITFKNGKVYTMGSPDWFERVAEQGLDGEALEFHLEECLPLAQEKADRFHASKNGYRHEKPKA